MTHLTGLVVDCHHAAILYARIDFNTLRKLLPRWYSSSGNRINEPKSFAKQILPSNVLKEFSRSTRLGKLLTRLMMLCGTLNNHPLFSTLLLLRRGWLFFDILPYYFAVTFIYSGEKHLRNFVCLKRSPVVEIVVESTASTVVYYYYVRRGIKRGSVCEACAHVSASLSRPKRAPVP